MRIVTLTLLTMLVASATPWRAAAEQVKSDTALAKSAKTRMICHTPFPPYPYQSRATGEQGSGTIKVTFDEHGKAVRAVMVNTTGYKKLDQNSVYFALANWKSSGGRRVTIVVPLTYRLR